MAKFSMNVWFANRISTGGYCVDDGHVKEVDPKSAYDGLVFTEELYVAALREIVKLREVLEQPTISQSEKNLRTIQFYNQFGPLTGPAALEPTGEPINVLSTLLAHSISVSKRPKPIRKFEMEIIQKPDESGKLVPHIKPEFFIEALMWAIEFKPEKAFRTCKYFLQVGTSRKRNKGKVCPRFCVIKTDGRRQWDEGCQVAYREFEAKRQEGGGL